MHKDIDILDTDELEKESAKIADDAARKRYIQDDDIRWLMSTKRGRRIVWRLLESSGVFRLSFNVDAMTMAFNEGNRNFGNQFLAEINGLCPERYLEMLKESKHGSKRKHTS